MRNRSRTEVRPVAFVLILLLSLVACSQSRNDRDESKDPVVTQKPKTSVSVTPRPAAPKKSTVPGVDTPDSKVTNRSSESGLSEADRDQKIRPREKPTEVTTTQPTSSWLNVLLDWFVWGGIILVAVAALGGILFYFLKMRPAKRAEEAREMNRMRSDISRNRKDLEDLRRRLESFAATLAENRTEIRGLHAKGKEASDNRPLIVQEREIEQPPKPEFPVSAEEFRQTVLHSAIPATFDSFTGCLVEDSARGEEFLIIKKPTEAIAIPNVPRFSAKSDYLNFYQKFYECERPSGGEIWIKSPARVQQTVNGWQVTLRGELEVR